MARGEVSNTHFDRDRCRLNHVHRSAQSQPALILTSKNPVKSLQSLDVRPANSAPGSPQDPLGHGTAIESLNERIAEYDRRIEQITKEVYPQVAVLKQVEVGPLIALTFVLTLDDPYRSPQQGGEVFSRIASRS
jgi:hypothetical protein